MTAEQLNYSIANIAIAAGLYHLLIGYLHAFRDKIPAKKVRQKVCHFSEWLMQLDDLDCLTVHEISVIAKLDDSPAISKGVTEMKVKKYLALLGLVCANFDGSKKNA